MRPMSIIAPFIVIFLYVRYLWPAKARQFRQIKFLPLIQGSNGKRYCHRACRYVFFLAMFITNDITLITLVPLTLIIFSSGKAPLTKRRMHLLVITLVLESLSANFGGMMMPFGSPQNIYLYSFFNMTMLTFFTTMLPFAVSGIIVLLFIMHFIKYDDTITHADQTSDIAIKEPISHGSEKLIIFIFLFALAIASVAHVLDYRLVTLIILVATILLDWKALKK